MGWSCARCAGSNPDGTRFCGHCGTARATSDAETRAAQLAPVVDERREVTSLFADISGFTTLSETLEPEDLHGIIRPVIAGLAAVAERYEGYMVKYAGDALLVFFGAPVAHEDDPERALLVALEMHSTLPELVKDMREEAAGLSLHIGIATGQVVSGNFGGDVRADYSILGDAVNTAQRLESVAPGGATYVSEATYRAASARFAFESVGELTLKGKREPVPAYKLLGRQTAPALAPTNVSRLVGRGSELGAIRPLLDPTTYGAAVVAVAGDPGVGKSRLLQQVREDVQAGGGRWVDTRCLSYGAALPYWPIVDLVRRLVGVAPDDRADVAARRLHASPVVPPDAEPFLARLLGAGPDTGHHPEAFRRHLHDAVASLLVGVGAGRPVTVAVEDAHWADASTLALLRDLLAAGMRLYVTARPEGTGALQTLLDAAPPGRSVTVALGPLPAPAVGELLSEVLGGDVPTDLVATVTALTNGNPLFIEEVARSLRERGALEKRHDRWRLADPSAVDQLPDTLGGVLAGRIDLLPPRAAAVLQIASVVGRLVRVPLLRAAADEVVDIDTALSSLVDAGFLDVTQDGDERVLAFHHALVQQVAYERLLRRQREEMHLRVARAAVELYGDGDDVVELLARHLYLGGAGVDAVDALRRAGQRAAALFATEEAILHLHRAAATLEAAGDVDALTSVLLEVADLHAVRGDYDQAAGLFERVRSADPGSVDAWRGEAAVLRRKGDYRTALEVVDAAFATAVGQPAALAGLWLERGWTCSLTGRIDDAVLALETGLALAGDDVEARGRLLAQVARAHELAGRFDEALAAADAAVAALSGGDHDRGLVSALRIAGSVQRHLGDLDAATVTLHRAVALASRTSTIEELAGSLLNLGMLHFEREQLDEAIACDRRAVAEFERLDHGSGQAVGYGNLAEKLLVAGDVDGAIDWAERALAKATLIGHAGTLADAGLTYARALHAAGRHDDAARAAIAAAAEHRAIGDAHGAAACEQLAVGRADLVT